MKEVTRLISETGGYYYLETDTKGASLKRILDFWFSGRRLFLVRSCLVLEERKPDYDVTQA